MRNHGARGWLAGCHKIAEGPSFMSTKSEAKQASWVIYVVVGARSI